MLKFFKIQDLLEKTSVEISQTTVISIFFFFLSIRLAMRKNIKTWVTIEGRKLLSLK